MRQPDAPSRRFSLFGLASAPPAAVSRRVNLDPPRLKLESDREVYRPGDPITITIEIRNPTNHCSLLIEKLSFECKGIEKLDTQWFNTPKPIPHLKQQRRGEYVFMDCSTSTIVSNQIISSGATKTYLARVLLPDTIPPSYRGTTIRYLYYCMATLSGQFLFLENGLSHGDSILEFPQLEVRLPLQIWVTQKSMAALLKKVALMVKVNEAFDGIEEGYESSKDEISSVSSYNQMKDYINKGFGSSLSLQSLAARSSGRGSLYVEGRPSISTSMAFPRLSAAEVLHDSTADRSSAVGFLSQAPKHPIGLSAEDDSITSSGSGSTESGASEGIVRGRSYNIRLDDQVLLKFSPKNSESTYYFSDMIGGTLTFLHEEGARRCLELTITLEAKETVNRRFVHSSRRHAPTITKIHSDHHEVVADLFQTSFLFSIPVDGPMTFSTSFISVQWSLRFEFLTTPKKVDWTSFEHPLLIEGRDKCEWVLPITVHSPPLVAAAAQTRNEKLLFSGPMWIRT